MAYVRGVAQREHGSAVRSTLRRNVVADEERRPMQPVKAGASDAVIDLTVGPAAGSKLRAGHRPVLGRRELGRYRIGAENLNNVPISGGLLSLSTTVVENLDNVGAVGGLLRFSGDSASGHAAHGAGDGPWPPEGVAVL
jgi:hypothetical protein